MLNIILQRLLQGLIVIFSLITITFFLVRAMPGDPFTNEKKLSPQTIQKNKEFYGLDKPLPAQYFIYLGNVIRGDLGPSSSKEGRDVNTIIGSSFPVSFVLGIGAMIVAISIGIPLGVLAALMRNSIVDHAGMAVALIGICIPSFVLGPLLAVYVGAGTGLFNVAGWDHWSDIVLPSITLGLATGAYLARLTRGGMLEILHQDFVRTARAKGVSTARIILRHTLRGGLIPSIAYVGPAFAGLLSGSFIVETIFQVPGLGQHFIGAATARDYNLIQGVVLFFGILIVIANVVVDLVQIALNPRLRGA